MPAATLEYYSSANYYDSALRQGRRMSGPYLPQTSSTTISSMLRRNSVQPDGSLLHRQSMYPPGVGLNAQLPIQCPAKPTLRNVLSAPTHQLPAPGLMARRDSVKSQSGDSTSGAELARYKTELCRPFEETGQCRYGAKCQFAHGMQELRSLNRHPKYKTELCRTYHSTGFCSYGQRCNFIHTEEPRRMSASAAVPGPHAHHPAASPFGSQVFPKVLPFDFPLSVNSTGDSPASSVDGGSPTHSPAFLNDDVFSGVNSALRLSPTPSYGSDSGSAVGSGVFPPSPGSSELSDDAEAQSMPSPLDIGLQLGLLNLRL